jgi:hypothetical protein
MFALSNFLIIAKRFDLNCEPLPLQTTFLLKMILVYLYLISKVMKNKCMKKVTIETKYNNS